MKELIIKFTYFTLPLLLSIIRSFFVSWHLDCMPLYCDMLLNR